MLGGREYRAIGLNIPHLHQSYVGTWFHIARIHGTPENARHAMVDALDDAQTSGIAFVRFSANPRYPLDTAGLYTKDPARYWRSMDQLIAECRRRGIKLIPSLQTLHGWYLTCGEPAQAVLDRQSRTYAATHR